jgi:hypothetical protein
MPQYSTPTETSHSASGRAWLEQWPAARRTGLANLFCEAVRAGNTTPDRVVAHVQQAVSRRLQWSTREERRVHFHQVLMALAADRPGTLAYAETVIAWEALPYDVRQAAKHERAAHYQQQHMADLPPTDKQLTYLRSLGYAGTAPGNRAEASALI